MDEHWCPLCPGHGVPIGALGRKQWYRCRSCGLDFYVEVDQLP